MIETIQEALKELNKEDFNIEELPGLNGNAYSGSRYLFYGIKKDPERIIESLNEGIDFEFEKDKRGGMIIFSTDINAQKLSSNKLLNWLKQKFETISNRLTVNKKINDLATKHNVPAWSVGRFLRGRYLSKDKKLFDENSLSLEIVGFPKDELIKVAEDLCREFKQETVLVKCYCDDTIFLVNQN